MNLSVKNKSVVFVVPYWNDPGNVGMLRASRLVRWLKEEHFRVTVIRAGLSDRQEETGFGEVITIRDPLKMYPDTELAGEGTKLRRVYRNPNPFRRWCAYALLVPDLSIVWARRAMYHSMVLKSAARASWFLASSPPESGFITAAHLAKLNDGQFVMDMRDGWLDEPLKPLLRSSGIQKWREGRLERRMVHRASVIFVTSEQWKQKLSRRYPEAGKKMAVLTNACPHNTYTGDNPSITQDTINDSSHDGSIREKSPPGKIRFLHAGRIFSSGPGRRLEHLLDHLLKFAHSHPGLAEIVFLGDLVPEEEQQLNGWKRLFESSGWKWIRREGVEHRKALALMQKADVLLLVSASTSAIPAKFFDYLSTGKPILAASFPNSALADSGRKVHQYYGFTIGDAVSASKTLETLMTDLKNHSVRSNRPDVFDEKFLKPKFISVFQ